MATDFTYNNKTIESSGGFKPSEKDTPVDARTRVNLKADIDSIPNPYVGMHIVVLQDESNNNEMTEYIVKSLKANDLGVANSKVDEIASIKDFYSVVPNFTFAVNMIAADQTASVTTTGTYPNLTITFNIPQGTGTSSGSGSGSDDVAGTIETTYSNEDLSMNSDILTISNENLVVNGNLQISDENLYL